MKKAIGMLVMLMGLTANAQSINAQVDTLKDGTITIELDNTYYMLDVKSKELSLYNVTEDKMGAMLTNKYILTEVVLPKRYKCPNQKK